MSSVYGVVIGLVIDVRDPLGQGRVRVRFPWLADENAESGWAPVARPMAGRDRGYWYAPEVDDEALVAFEHGDVAHPMVLGFLHNGQDKPPSAGVDEHVRRVKSVSGHVLELDDRAGSESIRLHTPGGHQLELHDPSGHAELVTSSGHKLRMENLPGSIALTTAGRTEVRIDDVPSQITLTTAAGVTVTISDIGGVSVSAPAGAVSVNTLMADVTCAASATLTAPAMTLNAAMLNVASPLAMFTGVVQCSALLTQAVVSSSYSPGLGNLV